MSFCAFPSCDCNTSVNCLRLSNPEKPFSLHLHNILLSVNDAFFKDFFLKIVCMCLCGGISTGAHRDKKRVLDDPGPGGCDLDM